MCDLIISCGFVVEERCRECDYVAMTVFCEGCMCVIVVV